MKEHTIRMRRLRQATFAVILTLVAGAACAGASMSSDVGQQSYAVTVINELDHPMIVSLDDGSSTRLLGTVGADREERFVLYGAASATVTLVATDEAETQTVRRTVALQPGSAVEVRIN